MSTPSTSRLTIGISCLHSSLPHVLSELSLARIDCAKIAVVQPDTPLSETEKAALQEQANKQQIALIWQSSCGLSRSRNALIDACETELLLLADDDQLFCEQGISQACEWMAEHSQVALLTGQFAQQGGIAHKSYPPHVQAHTQQTRRTIASIEMMLRPALLATVRFDERFGLGAAFPAGEEALFAEQLARNEATLWYAPFLLAQHDAVSTGQRRDAGFYYARGALWQALYGTLGLFYLPKLLLGQSKRTALPFSRMARAVFQGFWAARSTK